MEEEGGSDSDAGPNPLGHEPRQAKRLRLDRQVLTLLDALPNATRYEKSWMHRARVSQLAYMPQNNFLATGSEDGVIKFWKHVGGAQLLEFVKQFQAHTNALSSLTPSADGESLCSTSAVEQTVRFFLVRTFDMAAFVNTREDGFFPNTSCWLGNTLVAIACAETPRVRIYNAEQCSLHREISNLSPKHATICMAHYVLGRESAMISADAGGVISYWGEPSGNNMAKTDFEFKMETDLFALAKLKLRPTCIRVSSSSSHGGRFVVCASDGSIRLFDFRMGKILHTFPPPQLAGAHPAAFTRGVLFDQSGRLLLVPSAEHKCVEVYDLDTFQLVSSQLASRESELDFAGEDGTEGVLVPFALFQGILKTDFQLERNLTGAMSGSTTTSREERTLQHPILCCALGEQRFAVFTQNEPLAGAEKDEQAAPSLAARNVLNEKPTASQIAKELLAEKQRKAQGLAKHCVLHTTLGDIHIELFPLECPKTVENFIGHASAPRNTYSGVRFHRVIRNFMIQTGDPVGDGSGGESIWGGTFEDEFSPALHFNQPFLVCMANRGRDTNGSQFFITVPGGNGCAHLEGKHTIFGKVVGESSQEVVKKIELVKVDSKDRPLRDVKIVGVSVM